MVRIRHRRSARFRVAATAALVALWLPLAPVAEGAAAYFAPKGCCHGAPTKIACHQVVPTPAKPDCHKTTPQPATVKTAKASSDDAPRLRSARNCGCGHDSPSATLAMDPTQPAPTVEVNPIQLDPRRPDLVFDEPHSWARAPDTPPPLIA